MIETIKLHDAYGAEVQILIQPERLAELFWSLEANEMRKFFNSLGKLGTPNDFNTQFVVVLREICPTTPLTEDGISALDGIGNAVDAFHSGREDHG